MGKNKWHIDNKWFSFWFGNHFEFSYELCGYFDNRPRITISLIFFHLELIIPYRNEWTDECDPPKWGIAIHNKTFWIYKGGKGNMSGGNDWWTFEFPFINKKWLRTSYYLSNGEWEHSTNDDRKEFYQKYWHDRKKTMEYLYTDTDGSRLMAYLTMSEREIGRKWLTWIPYFNETTRHLNIEFKNEVGVNKNSYKGGVLGTSYMMKKDETMIDCIKRFEKDNNL